MIEQDLNALRMEKLSALLMQTLNELFAMERNKEDKAAIREKKRDVEHIQRILIARRKELPPGSTIR